jgi:hypothetical protein
MTLLLGSRRWKTLLGAISMNYANHMNTALSNCIAGPLKSQDVTFTTPLAFRCHALALFYALLFLCWAITVGANSGFSGEASMLWGLRMVENFLLLLFADGALLCPLLLPPASGGAILAMSARISTRSNTSLNSCVHRSLLLTLRRGLRLLGCMSLALSAVSSLFLAHRLRELDHHRAIMVSFHHAVCAADLSSGCAILPLQLISGVTRAVCLPTNDQRHRRRFPDPGGVFDSVVLPAVGLAALASGLAVQPKYPVESASVGAIALILRFAAGLTLCAGGADAADRAQASCAVGSASFALLAVFWMLHARRIAADSEVGADGLFGVYHILRSCPQSLKCLEGEAYGCRCLAGFRVY